MKSIVLHLLACMPLLGVSARALACKAQTYAFLFSYPPHIIPIPEPIRPLPVPICIDPTTCGDDELGSPN